MVDCWRGSGVSAFDCPALLHEIVALGASRHPDRIAFRCREHELSYAALAAAVSAQAGQLRELGVKPGDRVGVMLPKCIEAPVAVFGIMAAGAAYVPLDPSMPAQRLEFIINDCDLAVLITHPGCKRTLTKALADLPVASPLQHLIFVRESVLSQPRPGLSLHAQCTDPTQSAFDLRASPVTEAALAYIMYTSGSTGDPKGLMHTHASGLAYAAMSARLYGLRGDDRLASHSPLHFDMSTLDYFSGPLAGACSVILTESHMKMPASMSALIDDERLTIWYSVPYALIQLLLHGVLDQRDLSSLRWVLYGGEPFSPRHLGALMDRLPDARFGNVYGPAEVNQVSFFEITERPHPNVSSIPIGQPVNNADVVILDADDQEVTGTDIGEFVVRTPQMMQGYWKRPQLSAGALVKRPDFRYFDSVWCRTGDLVNRDADGQLQFLGRRDRLVKTRGNRVELDEVEAALVQVDRVEEAAAFIYAEGDDSQEIGAAISLADVGEFDEKSVRAAVAGRLPGYAVPRRIVVLTDMPRTASDKIDRRQLSRWFELGPNAQNPEQTHGRKTQRENMSVDCEK